MNVTINSAHDSNSVFSAFGIRKQRLNLDRKEASFEHDKQAINQDERDVLQDAGHFFGNRGEYRPEVNRLSIVPEVPAVPRCQPWRKAQPAIAVSEPGTSAPAAAT